jgi:hypothetical protein
MLRGSDARGSGLSRTLSGNGDSLGTLVSPALQRLEPPWNVRELGSPLCRTILAPKSLPGRFLAGFAPRDDTEACIDESEEKWKQPLQLRVLASVVPPSSCTRGHGTGTLHRGRKPRRAAKTGARWPACFFPDHHPVSNGSLDLGNIHYGSFARCGAILPKDDGRRSSR